MMVISNDFLNEVLLQIVSMGYFNSTKQALSGQFVSFYAVDNQPIMAVFDFTNYTFYKLWY